MTDVGSRCSSGSGASASAAVAAAAAAATASGDRSPVLPLSISVRTTCCSTKNAPAARARSHSSSRAGNSVDISRASTSGETRSRLSCAYASSATCSWRALANRCAGSRASARITIASSASG